IGLKQYAMIYRLLKRLLSEPTKPDILLIDRTLLVPKEFANSDDGDVQKEYAHLAKTANGFWYDIRELLFPLSPEGLVVVGFPDVKRLGEPLWSIADDRADALIDAVSVAPIQSAIQRGRNLDEGAASRIMATILWPEQRSAAFAYSGLRMDPRT